MCGILFSDRGWYKGFKTDCPDGTLHKEKVSEMMRLILPDGEESNKFVDQIFRIFDKDGDGAIDFKEFLLATNMSVMGTPEDKLKWTFGVSQSHSLTAGESKKTFFKEISLKQTRLACRSQ